MSDSLASLTSPVSSLSPVSPLLPASPVLPVLPMSLTSPALPASAHSTSFFFCLPSPLLSSLSSETTPLSQLALLTFKVVGDNIDKHIKPHEMRMDAQATTLHYFNMYAVKDRINMSALSNVASLPDISSVNLNSVLPCSAEETKIFHNFSILVGRVLKKRMPFFFSLLV